MGERSRIATAALVRDGRVLLGHRHPRRRHYPDCWDLVGGHVEPGETPRQAVVRECLEEIGVHVHDPRPLALGVRHPTLDLHGFVVTRWDGEVRNVAPEEHDELRWFGADELPGLVLAHPGSLAAVVDAVRADG